MAPRSPSRTRRFDASDDEPKQLPRRDFLGHRRRRQRPRRSPVRRRLSARALRRAPARPPSRADDRSASSRSFRIGRREDGARRRATRCSSSAATDGEFRAFSALCTHLQCVVGYSPERNQIECPCHQGVYSHRRAEHPGPPPRPLDELRGHDQRRVGHREHARMNADDLRLAARTASAGTSIAERPSRVAPRAAPGLRLLPRRHHAVPVPRPGRERHPARPLLPARRRRRRIASVERIVGGASRTGISFATFHVWASDLFVAVALRPPLHHPRPAELPPAARAQWISGLVVARARHRPRVHRRDPPVEREPRTRTRASAASSRSTCRSSASGCSASCAAATRSTRRTLGHAFGFHVAALPAALTLLVGVHLFFLSRKPAARPTRTRRTIPLYPDFLVRQAVAFTGLTVVIMTLASSSIARSASPPTRALPPDRRRARPGTSCRSTRSSAPRRRSSSASTARASSSARRACSARRSRAPVHRSARLQDHRLGRLGSAFVLLLLSASALT